MAAKKKELVKVPQVTIDGESFHASAQVAFGIVDETEVTGEGDNKMIKPKFKLLKYVLVGNKVASSDVVREGKDLPTLLIQSDLELRNVMTKKRKK